MRHTCQLLIAATATIAIFELSAEATAENVKVPVPVNVKHKNSHKSWKTYKTTTYDHLADHKATTIKTGKYAGRMDRREKATGFFYVKKLSKDGPWTFVDPEGYHFICVGVNSTNLNLKVDVIEKAFAKIYGDSATWAKKTKAYVFDELGFNTLACWSDWKAFKVAGVPIPYCRRWNFMSAYGKKRNATYAKYGHTGFNGECIPVFDPEFETFCDTRAKGLLETKDDPWLLGHFSDNELPFDEGDIIKRYLALPEADPGHKAARKWLDDGGIDAKTISKKHDSDFGALVIGRYYEIVNKAMKKYDPNHLFLGTRFHGRVTSQECTFRAAAPNVDVISVNYYHRWTPEQARVDSWAKWSGKPIIITEWYAKGADSGCDNSQGAGFTVPTQPDRGKFYQNYTIGLMRNRNILGWHWFRYTDDPISKKSESCNKGILSQDFKPWKPLAKDMKQLNDDVYGLRDYLLKARSKNLLDKPAEYKK